MKHATTRILFAYWDALRGERAAPERGDVRPGGMRQVLSDAFILSNEGDTTFRLAGTRICALFGRDLAGFPFRRLFPASDAVEVERMLDFVLEEMAGIVVGALGANANGSELALEMLLLPLRHGGRTDTRLLGALSPATLPSWAGLVPLTELRIRSARTIETTRLDSLPVEFVSGGNRRHALTVHDGGIA